MNENKRGQLTIFIIIAVVMVAVIATIIIIQTTGEAPRSEFQVVKDYLDSCFEEKAKETIIDTAKQGFYYELPEESINFLEEKTAYYFKDENNLVPTITTIEQQLSLAMNQKMLPCLALTQFRNEYEITRDECFSEATLKDDSIQFSINCPITIKKAGITSTLRDFNTNIFCNAKKLINASNFIVQRYKLDYLEDPNFICLTCLGDIGVANDVEINVIPITKEVFIPEHVWFILKADEKIDNKNLTLRFVTD